MFISAVQCDSVIHTHTHTRVSVCVRLVTQSCLTLATPWTVACKNPRSTGFSRQDYRSGLPCPLPGDLPDPGIKPVSLKSPALADGFFTTCTTWEAYTAYTHTHTHTHTYILFYIYSLQIFSSIIVHHKILNILLVLYNRVLLFI